MEWQNNRGNTIRQFKNTEQLKEKVMFYLSKW